MVRPALLRRVSPLLAALPLNRVRRLDEGGRTYYLKTRRWYAPGLIWGANTFLGAPFLTLPQHEWLRWEPRLYRLFYNLEVHTVAGRLLRIPALPGMPLACTLVSSSAGLDDKIAALHAAAGALRDLHRLPVRFPDGGERPWSHGDATVENVLYDPTDGRARWFDFETVHPRHWPALERHADDLRALLCSAAARLPLGDLPWAAGAVAAAYGDAQVTRALSRRLAHLRAHPNLLALGQAGLEPRELAALMAALPI